MSDPYRGLEDANSTDTKQFVEQHNTNSQTMLQNSPDYRTFKEKYSKLLNYKQYYPLERHGDFYYFFMNTGLQKEK